ncbi:hypothetical protein D1AOALGA4SA_11696 [Olavius algarvensis Delta 1 endosymbiont]|nr:hypothetical protein D1AOALGA4SA_11696 [Olavius algarvensis Delta 1 endosymbiont]
MFSTVSCRDVLRPGVLPSQSPQFGSMFSTQMFFAEGDSATLSQSPQFGSMFSTQSVFGTIIAYMEVSIPSIRVNVFNL